VTVPRPSATEDLREEMPTISIIYDFSTEAQLITISTVVLLGEDHLGSFFFIRKSDIVFNDANSKSRSFSLADVEMVLHRPYLHVDRGSQILPQFAAFVFLLSPARRSPLHFAAFEKSHSPEHEIAANGTVSQDSVPHFSEQWTQGKLSNYVYLMYLNLLADRSFNDLSQYPVFPWILTNYESEELDLKNPNNFRDLTKPIGALNAHRIEAIRKKRALFDPENLANCFFFSSHYSKASYVLHYLVRVESLTTPHISMYNQKFDDAERPFSSISKCFESISGITSDFQELIPEFFTFPEFLLNADGFDLGNDVIFPPWAHNSPHEFIHMHREALKSEFVSAHLNDHP
jgi:hypothetical protein